MKRQAKFITFEGGEGSGKTTQIHKLYEYLKSQNIPVILTREVGGCPNAEKIRELFLNSEMLPMSELMLVMAARYEHVSSVIVPALKEGTWILCDRFVDSTACYQGEQVNGRQNLIYELHEEIIGPLFTKINIPSLPDITFFMDIKPEEGLKRTKKRNNNNRFEDKELLFHQKIYETFLKLAKRFKNRIIPIKANGLSADEIHQLVKKNLNL